MDEDLMKKSIQGEKFKKIGNKIMKIDHSDVM